jgi:hypothetical protein
MVIGGGEAVFLNSSAKGAESPFYVPSTAGFEVWRPSREHIRTMCTMNIDQKIMEKLRMLSLEQQREVLDFVEFLQQKKGIEKRPRRSLRGLWADLGVHLSEEDLAEARREMWGSFPREDI